MGQSKMHIGWETRCSLEVSVDYLKVLFQDEHDKHDFVFLLGHSNGHVKNRINNFDASK